MSKLSIAVLCVFAVVIAGLVLPSFNTSHHRSYRISCASNLKQIGLALKQYSMDYNDHYPPYDGVKSMQILMDKEYLTDIYLFVCPSAERDNKNGVFSNVKPPLTEELFGYVFKGGMTEEDSADSAICWSKPCNHTKYGNVLFLDGHVKGYAGNNWMDVIKNGAK